jgi:hypothetical protein
MSAKMNDSVDKMTKRSLYLLPLGELYTLSQLHPERMTVGLWIWFWVRMLVMGALNVLLAIIMWSRLLFHFFGFHGFWDRRCGSGWICEFCGRYKRGL